MAKLVLLCQRFDADRPSFQDEVRRLAERLTPDNLPPAAPKILADRGVSIAIFNSNELIPTHQTSVAMGWLFETPGLWHIPGEKIPDGSMALFRCSEDQIELATDMVASRSIWYATTPSMFLASTSQRALIYFLGSFEVNETACAWMLSSGTLGPGQSWDKRIKSLAPNSRLFLDRRSWRTRLVENEIGFHPKAEPTDKLRRALQGIIETTLGGIEFDPSDWILPLSGGVDSRMLLLHLHKKNKGIQCVTWGTAEARQKRWNDARIAGKLCRALHLDHTYSVTETSKETFGTVFHRFLSAGEGRIDHVEPYLDGFDLWRHMAQMGVKGIIRGDECFGSRTLYSELDFRKFIFATMLNDYEEFRELGLHTAYPHQAWPNKLQKTQHETMEMWRDRLYIQYYFPVALSALNDLKLSYVEIMNPLISNKTINFVQQLPDRLRTEKRLFREAVRALSPPVPFARYPAIDLGRTYLKQADTLTFITESLRSDHCRRILPKTLLDQTERAIHFNGSRTVGQRFPFIRKIRPFVPPKAVKALQKRLKLSERVDYHDLALRCCIVDGMERILSEDAQAYGTFQKTLSMPVGIPERTLPTLPDLDRLSSAA